ncbi:unnamed protein product [Lupinus luteus]|uniref:Uncharacterized protein n=1 Tax=Lupinus luteus TaxID=3873 RepID=A0AAV1X132_LUPLU
MTRPKATYIPQQPGTRIRGKTITGAFILVFVDEEWEEEIELLRKNPLHNFPDNNLP